MGKPQASETRKELSIAAFYNAELFVGCAKGFFVRMALETGYARANFFK